MEEKTRPYRMEANAGVDLDVETEDEGTEIGITAQVRGTSRRIVA
jgi:hypothetical protein